MNDKAFTRPKGRVLARLVKKSGTVYQEVKLDTGGNVYHIMYSGVCLFMKLSKLVVTWWKCDEY